MDDTNIRFSHFIAELALNPATLALYMKEPETAMEAAGLSEDDKRVLLANDFRDICDWLRESGPRPITQNQGGPGSLGTGEPGG